MQFKYKHLYPEWRLWGFVTCIKVVLDYNKDALFTDFLMKCQSNTSKRK